MVAAPLGAVAQEQQTVITVAPYLQARGEEYDPPFLTVYANDELCGRLSFDDPGQISPDGTTALVLGTPEQPAACGIDGAIISIFHGDRIRFVDTYRLTVGERIVIANFTIPPIGSGNDATPQPPDTGFGFEASGGGPGGLPTSTPVMLGAALVLAGLALHAAARRRTS